MKKIFVCMLVAATAAFAQIQQQPAGGQRWTNVGPGGGGIQSIAASFLMPMSFVGCDVGGFYRSTDGGKSYQIHNTGLRKTTSWRWLRRIRPIPS